MEQIFAAGVDGCRKGWCVVTLGRYSDWSVSCCSTIEEFWQECRAIKLALIDIPIGLRDGGEQERKCDLEARRLLGKRASSVFRPPCRSALSAVNYDQALFANRVCTGKGISLQAFHITAKIAEVDRFLSRHPQARGVIRETHPELCYFILAQGLPMRLSKKTQQGRRERRDILSSFCPWADDIIKYGLDNFLRREVAEDDILDALAAALVALLAGKEGCKPDTIPAQPETDSCGLPMEIVLYGNI